MCVSVRCDPRTVCVGEGSGGGGEETGCNEETVGERPSLNTRHVSDELSTPWYTHTTYTASLSSLPPLTSTLSPSHFLSLSLQL